MHGNSRHTDVVLAMQANDWGFCALCMDTRP